MTYEKIEQQRINAHKHFPRHYNWDAKGGKPVNPTAINLASDIAGEIYGRFGLESSFIPNPDGSISVYAHAPFLGNVFTVFYDIDLQMWMLDFKVYNAQTTERIEGCEAIADDIDYTLMPQEDITIWNRLTRVMHINQEIVEESKDLASLERQGRLHLTSAKHDHHDHDVSEPGNKNHRVGQSISEALKELNQQYDPLWGCLIRLPSDYEPWGNRSDYERGPDCSCGCKWFRELDKDHPESTFGMDWGICTNPDSPRSGMLTWEHQNGYTCFEPDDEDDV